jgi:hypothetical protein
LLIFRVGDDYPYSNSTQIERDSLLVLLHHLLKLLT